MHFKCPSQIQSNFGSCKSWFSNNALLHQVIHGEKMSRLSNKTSGLYSLPDNPFMLIPVWWSTHLSGNKGHLGFEQITSWTVFWNELSSRTEVPLYNGLVSLSRLLIKHRNEPPRNLQGRLSCLGCDAGFANFINKCFSTIWGALKTSAPFVNIIFSCSSLSEKNQILKPPNDNLSHSKDSV